MEKLTNIPYIKSLLARFTATDAGQQTSPLGAKKKFGQNFLVNDPTLTQIITAAQLTPEDTVIEIGPGLGVLTRELCLHGKHVIAIEKDRDMIAALNETIIKNTPGAKEKITILQQDALQFDPSTHPLTINAPYKLVANLPYNVATPILENFLVKTAKRSEAALPAPHQPSCIVVLVQKEVAEKACAKPGDHNVLSLTLQPYGTAKIIATVSPSSFFPPPKVTSSILTITPYATPLLSENLAPTYFRLIHAAFSQKRKMLGKSLQQLAPKETILAALTKANIPPEIRPQELTLENWLILAENF